MSFESSFVQDWGVERQMGLGLVKSDVGRAGRVSERPSAVFRGAASKLRYALGIERQPTYLYHTAHIAR
jgi:hypothetical protein